MCLSLYELRLRTLTIDLHAKKSAQNLQVYRKKLWKTVPSVKFTKWKARKSAKN